jgi:hypothetical protein
MELKNTKVGILIYDPTLRRMLSDLLNKNGAKVFSTDNDEEIEKINELIGLDVAVVEMERRIPFSLN